VYGYRRATATVLLVARDPANADERRRAASRGGRSKPNREIRDLKREL
jgi:hypothetical protein